MGCFDSSLTETQSRKHFFKTKNLGMPYVLYMWKIIDRYKENTNYCNFDEKFNSKWKFMEYEFSEFWSMEFAV